MTPPFSENHSKAKKIVGFLHKQNKLNVAIWLVNLEVRLVRSYNKRGFGLHECRSSSVAIKTFSSLTLSIVKIPDIRLCTQHFGIRRTGILWR